MLFVFPLTCCPVVPDKSATGKIKATNSVGKIDL